MADVYKGRRIIVAAPCSKEIVTESIVQGIERGGLTLRVEGGGGRSGHH
jgi:carbamate kinase